MFANEKQHRPTVNIILNGTNIRQVSHTTFLGVVCDNLTWREQITNSSNEGIKNIAVLHKTKHVLDEQYMSYCCEIWGNTYPSRLRKLFILLNYRYYYFVFYLVTLITITMCFT